MRNWSSGRKKLFVQTNFSALLLILVHNIVGYSYIQESRFALIFWLTLLSRLAWASVFVSVVHMYDHRNGQGNSIGY